MSENQTVEVSEKLTKIIESIETLSVLELSQLVKALEKKFGVSAAAPVAMMAGPAAAGAAAPGKRLGRRSGRVHHCSRDAAQTHPATFRSQ